MGKLTELLTGGKKQSHDEFQRNMNWIDQQIKNLEQTKFIIQQQIDRYQTQKEKLTEKFKK